MIDAMGFVGIESYDLILYLAMTMQALNTSVLVIDNSDDWSLAECIPGLPEAADGEPVDYRGITAAKGMSELPDNYDYILVYYGKSLKYGLESVNEVYLVTDYQKHNINFLRDVELTEDNFPFLVVRDRVVSKVTPESILLELEELGITNESLIPIEDSQSDLHLKVMCQYNSLIGLARVSDSIKEFISIALSEDYEAPAIKAAFKAVTRRK